MAGSLADLQASFAGHIRNPDQVPAPGDIEDRRMAIYRDLFFSNLSNFIARSFPVLRRLYTQENWDQLMREFFNDYRCHTPLFPEIPREFLQYLQDHRAGREDDPPFMLELAHYEWVEIALDLDEADLDSISTNPEGDLLDGIALVSPLAWPLSYHYPVHLIRPDFQPSEPPAEPTHLLVYRTREDEVKFMQLNALTLLLITRLKEDRGESGHVVLSAVAAELNHPDPAAILEAGKSLLEDLRDKDIILGTRPGD